MPYSSLPSILPAGRGHRVGVVGAGYVGVVAAACLAELGHRVALHDALSERIEELSAGRSPIHEPGVEALLVRTRDDGSLRFESVLADAVVDAEIVLLAVGTPPGPHGDADLSALLTATRQLATLLRPGTVLAVKSTVPVGTGDAIERLLDERGVEGVSVVSHPEFLREGSAVHDFLHPDRVLVGGAPDAAERVAALYRSIPAPVVTTDRRAAEMAKYAANAFLATRISFANEIAAICERVGVDATVVTRVMGMDHRIGSHYLSPGAGFGGSCFPKDLVALVRTAERVDYHPELLRSVIAINRQQRASIVHRLTAELEGLSGCTVGLLGLAFKPDTDDLRDAPAVEIAGMLLTEGAEVRAYDPVAMAAAARLLPGVAMASGAENAAAGADAVVLLTEWAEFRALDLRRMRSVMRGRLLFDARNAIDPAAAAAAGLRYRGIGRGALEGGQTGVAALREAVA